MPLREVATILLTDNYHLIWWQLLMIFTLVKNKVYVNMNAGNGPRVNDTTEVTKLQLQKIDNVMKIKFIINGNNFFIYRPKF